MKSQNLAAWLAVSTILVAQAAVAVRPALDRWEGVEGSRPVDYATRLDSPRVLVLDARDRGATAAEAAGRRSRRCGPL